MKNSKSVQSFVSLCLSETNYDEEDYLYIDGHYVPVMQAEQNKEDYTVFIDEKYNNCKIIEIEEEKLDKQQELSEDEKEILLEEYEKTIQHYKQEYSKQLEKDRQEIIKNASFDELVSELRTRIGKRDQKILDLMSAKYIKSEKQATEENENNQTNNKEKQM